MIIGITGQMGSGKDTAADLLEGFKKVSFATPIKEACKAIFGWTDEHLNDRVLKEQVDPLYGVSPRYAMQTLGTEWGRDTINQSIWLIALLKHTGNIVVADVRFDNEAEFIIGRGGIILEIRRPKLEEVDSHASEQGISKHLITETIINDGSIEDLKRKLECHHLGN